MDYSKVAFVVILTVLVVIGINAAIYFSFARKRGAGQIELLRRAAQRARSPWENEDKALVELSKLVAGLKDKDTPAGDPDTPSVQADEESPQR